MGDPAKTDEYLTLAAPGEAKLKDRGSVFIGHAVPVASAGEADEQLDSWRRQYHDATHIGWGRRIAPPPDGEERCDDDGEPHGSTGPPILQAIQGADLWGVLVGVVRYYGGTKLGVGGLVRAYGGAAAEALEAAKVLRVVVTRRVTVDAPHDRVGAVYAVAERHGARVDPPEATVKGMTLTLHIAQSRAEHLAREIVDATAGRAEASLGEIDD